MGRMTQETLFYYDLSDGIWYTSIDEYEPAPALVGAMLVVSLIACHEALQSAVDDITYKMISEGLLQGRLNGKDVDRDKAMYYIAEGLYNNEMQFAVTDIGQEYLDNQKREL